MKITIEEKNGDVEVEINYNNDGIELTIEDLKWAIIILQKTELSIRNNIKKLL